MAITIFLVLISWVQGKEDMAGSKIHGWQKEPLKLKLNDSHIIEW